MDQQRGSGQHLPAPDQAVYGISVAAGLAGIGVQTLRLYERHGLLTPARSDGGTRRYSGNDLARLERITALVAAGVNLAGIGRILDLEDANADLHADNNRLRNDNANLREKP
ncbi:MerR family transcriptional regulator [Nocardia donostiensis]|uniref:MerR family transcriptional regulator n=1 Tax=Nocardia donostiensis TaxID=1538463 RepID=A0A1W0AV15_9NOCA|nr:MerR family transcriptional regulator [Nocardia donostiensis]ONM49084.1 MerR family transcriptional regulator [Nocardia donostiensis]OQS14102.1 MerR family transcriptional regulator [Nocardia donostiensis]OQS19737.1 MerR family transcriptional regulator [Nocardia donostiensis]